MGQILFPLGKYKGWDIEKVPLAVLAKYYMNTRFNRPQSKSLKQAIAQRLTHSKQKQYARMVIIKELEELLVTLTERKRKRAELQMQERKNNLRKLLNMFNYSPNHGFNESLDIEKILEQVLKPKT